MGKTRQLVPPVPRQLIPLVDVPDHRPWATVRWLRRAVYERRIPFHKLGDSRSARVFIDLADLDAYAEASRIEEAGDGPLASTG